MPERGQLLREERCVVGNSANLGGEFPYDYKDLHTMAVRTKSIFRRNLCPHDSTLMETAALTADVTKFALSNPNAAPTGP
jgi:hypothetical protein